MELELDFDMQEFDGFCLLVKTEMMANGWNYLESIGFEDGDFFISGATVDEEGRIVDEGTVSISVGEREE